MATKTKKEIRSFQKKYNLGKPRKREKPSEEDRLFFQAQAKKHRHVLEMGELWAKASKQRF